MYAPESAEYKAAMQQQIRPLAKVAMRVLQIDPVAQAGITVTSSGLDDRYTGGDYYITKVIADTDAYMLARKRIYRSAASAGWSAGDHGYAFATSPQITLQLATTVNHITMVWDPTYPPCHITIALSGGTHPSTTDCYIGYVDHLTVDTGDATTVTYAFRSMQMPGVSLSVYHAYAGTYIDVPSGDILSVDYHDTNDCVGLELPQITAKVVTRNDGTYDQITELTNPTFARYKTQCILQYGLQLTGGGTEYVAMPKLFLDAYTVNLDTVTWQFVATASVANNDTFPLLRLSANISNGYRALAVFSDILSASQSFFDQNGDAVMSPLRRYGVNYVISSINNSTVDIALPFPLISAAQALQLLCLYTRNCIYHSRGLADVTVNPILYNTVSLADLTDDQCYAKPSWSADNAADIITIRRYSYGQTTVQKTVVENAHVSASGATAVCYDDIVRSGTAVSAAGVTITHKTGFALYPHCVYLQAASDVDDVTITAQVHPVTTQDVSYRYGSGSDQITVDNPLVYARAAVLNAQYVADTVRSVLQYNVLGAVDHRGRPDLDAGDRVTVTKPDGTAAQGLIIDNAWSISAGGVMSGKTVFRLLS